MSRCVAARDRTNAKGLKEFTWMGEGNAWCGQMLGGQRHNEYKTVNREWLLWTGSERSET